MALTDPEIVALGYDLPVGTDWVRDGDNNISKNARTTANALVDLEERLPRARGILPSMDLNEARGIDFAGLWHLSPSNTYTNLPEEMGGTGWHLDVGYTGSGTSDAQRILTGAEEYRREANTASSWNSWQRNLRESDLYDDSELVASTASHDAQLALTPRNRGILPDGTDLDDCFGHEWAGSWALTSGNTYYNLPNSFNSSVNLEIISPLNSALSSTQRINVGGFSDQPTVGVYWRESNRSSGTGIWFDWYHIPAQPVGSESIRTIRTSTNPAATAGPDELLIILES